MLRLGAFAPLLFLLGCTEPAPEAPPLVSMQEEFGLRLTPIRANQSITTGVDTWRCRPDSLPRAIRNPREWRGFCPDPAAFPPRDLDFEREMILLAGHYGSSTASEEEIVGTTHVGDTLVVAVRRVLACEDCPVSADVTLELHAVRVERHGGPIRFVSATRRSHAGA